MLPSSIVPFVFGASAARLATHFGVRRTLVVGSLLSTLALVWSVVAHGPRLAAVLATCVSGIGTGVVFANLANAVLDAVPSGQAGTAIGMNANLRILGGAVGTAITVTIITADTRPNGHPNEQGYVWGFAFLAVISLVAALTATLIPGSSRRATSDDASAADSRPTRWPSASGTGSWRSRPPQRSGHDARPTFVSLVVVAPRQVTLGARPDREV